MILRATFENIFSFHKETSISFVAGKSTSLPTHVCRGQKKDDIPVLKSGVIYGANASGKSNSIRCIDFLRSIALKEIPKENWDVFKLGSERKNKSKLEIEFKVDDTCYAYGVVFSVKGIMEEWLYKINKRTDTLIFAREKGLDDAKYIFGKIEGDTKAQQFVSFLAEATPSNRSFLSEYKRRNGKGLESMQVAYSWFEDCLKIVFPNTHFPGISVRGGADTTFSAETKKLLNIFNTGIYDIKKSPIEKEEVNLPSKLISEVLSKQKPNQNLMLVASDKEFYFFETDSEGTTNIFSQKIIHKNAENKNIYFEMNEESDGSIRLLDFIPMLIDLHLNPVIYLIDEIDRSMHPMMSQMIFELYNQSLSSDRNTQLICTTHESHLLDTTKIRTDEVWFTEKDAGGATHFTSLAEYKPREDIRKGYLQGRYGAIPFFASIKSLNWFCDEKA